MTTDVSSRLASLPARAIKAVLSGSLMEDELEGAVGYDTPTAPPLASFAELRAAFPDLATRISSFEQWSDFHTDTLAERDSSSGFDPADPMYDMEPRAGESLEDWCDRIIADVNNTVWYSDGMSYAGPGGLVVQEFAFGDVEHLSLLVFADAAGPITVVDFCGV